VVSGEYISNLSWNAAKQIRSLFSKQLASLTLGDAGAAVIVERAPGGSGIDVIGFTTLAEHSRLCLAFRAPWARGRRCTPSPGRCTG
jgi:3-oxoacyl-[acyl-carrier-protein] synthase III